jgi:glutamine synthetase
MHERIATISDLFANQIGLQVHAAFELEFYLQNCKLPEKQEAFEKALRDACEQQNIGIAHFAKEDGLDQFEIALSKVELAIQAVDEMLLVREFIAQAAEKQGAKAIFAAKPFSDQPGSGLHLHLSLHEPNGENCFYKDDEQMSAHLEWSIGGILLWAPHVMPVYAPSEVSYARFQAKQHAPTTISWGANNRTVAVRLPMADHDNKHIELRLPGADAHPASVMAVTLAAMFDGLMRQSPAGPQIHGDASLEQYGMKKLPASLDEAKKACQQSDLYASYFSAEVLLQGTK